MFVYKTSFENIGFYVLQKLLDIEYCAKPRPGD